MSELDTVHTELTTTRKLNKEGFFWKSFVFELDIELYTELQFGIGKERNWNPLCPNLLPGSILNYISVFEYQKGKPLYPNSIPNFIPNYSSA